ncbi:MAG: hypothetical protein JXR97_09195, partial [Planctomycetes bacterium]|nr:hypothetical protein [Planctomycetota bacterium]
MITNPVSCIDPFWGNGEIDLPKPEGIAATWAFLKAQCGNTHPGACLPFGMVSTTAYSGGYPTGYGTHKHNTHGAVGKAHSSPCVSGFTHFQHSGTGAVRTYYNYLRVSPFSGDWKTATDLRPLL